MLSDNELRADFLELRASFTEAREWALRELAKIHPEVDLLLVQISEDAADALRVLDQVDRVIGR